MSLDRAGAALLPWSSLAALAGERCCDSVRVVAHGESAWVCWAEGDEAVRRALLAVRGIEFFEQREGLWHALGRSLPRLDLPPPGEAQRLDAIIFPAPLQSVSAPPGAITPVRLMLAPSLDRRPTSALRVTLPELLAWADLVPSAALAACRAAVCAGKVLLRGEPLPAIADAERFWGERVLIPLGWRPQPDLPESALREAAGVAPGELLLLTHDGPEAIPEAALGPLSRAALRLAARTGPTDAALEGRE
jgi:hypothetical protein